MIEIITGDCRAALAQVPSGSVNVCVTSPPYFGLRNYGVDGQIGIEKTPDEFIAELVDVFREVRRVLRDDGTLWVNIGDSYANDGKWGGSSGGKHVAGLHGASGIGRGKTYTGLKPKDLIGIPWMLAFALRADGWYLRSDNVWGKPNGMPESVKDRPTRSHEYVFQLSKTQNYYFDQEAVRSAPKATTQTQMAKPYFGQSAKGHEGTGVQNASDLKRRMVEKQRKSASPKYVGDGVQKSDVKARYYENQRKQRGHERPHDGCLDIGGKSEQMAEGGNLRSVFWISPAQYREGHFAVMPDLLAEICVVAGCPPGGMVLDPFGGAGTTGLAADRLGRNAILIELNPAYADMARRRIHGPLLAYVS